MTCVMSDMHGARYTAKTIISPLIQVGYLAEHFAVCALIQAKSFMSMETGHNLCYTHKRLNNKHNYIYGFYIHTR